MDNMMSKQEIRAKIQELNFCAVELNLFLDTHPTDQQALQDYRFVLNQIEQLHNIYKQRFGPLLNYGFASVIENNWTWVSEQEKWPWENK